MSDWHLQAYHDPRAEPVEDMWLQSSSQLDEYIPKLAEKAGLGVPNFRNPFNGRYFFANGEIRAAKVFNNHIFDRIREP